MPAWGDDNLTLFLQLVNSHQMGNLTKFPEPYGLMRRVNDCFAKAGNNLVNPKPTMTGSFFHRSQYAYMTTVGMALAGQVVEAFVMMRSCLEYAGYALVMFEDPTLEEVFFKRHFDDTSMKIQKQKFKFSEARAVIGKFDQNLANKFQKFYDRAIEFGAHPNPNAILIAFELDFSDSAGTFLNLALSTDEKSLLHTMKCTVQVGLTSLFIFQHIFKDRFKNLGISAEMDLLGQEYL